MERLRDDGSHGESLWKSDGTTAGTTMGQGINPSGDSNPVELLVVNGTLFFMADDGSHGRELWKSDGTTAGTTMVKDINPSGDSNPAPLTDVNGALYFGANDGTHGEQLWKSNGSGGGMSMVTAANPGGGGLRSPRPPPLTASSSLRRTTARTESSLGKATGLLPKRPL